MDARENRSAHVHDVCALVRRVLRERWPGVCFDISPRGGGYVTRLDIHWQDGPTRVLVDQVVEATLAAVDAPEQPSRVESVTRRTLTEEGVATALHMVVETPAQGWLTPNGQVSWLRFPLPQAHELMDEYHLPEPPASVHHLAALLAHRLDLSLAVAAPHHDVR